MYKRHTSCFSSGDEQTYIYGDVGKCGMGAYGGNMIEVAVVMGSDSDLSVMKAAGDFLEEMGIGYEYNIISAHRDPEFFFKWAKTLKMRGIKVVIAGAGKAAHLPGMCAAITPLPVVGVPIKTSDLGGVDSLYSIVQMPSGIPVATVAINGAKNAGILAARILAVGNEELFIKLIKFGETMADEVKDKDKRLKEKGVNAFL